MTRRWRLGSAGAALVLSILLTACSRPAEKNPPQASNGAPQPAATESAAAGSSAAVPSTPEPRGSMISLNTPGGEVRAYQVQPPGSGPFPAVVVVHEWWGLNRQIETVADRLSGLGYAVIVPDLYHGHVTDDPEKAHELLRGLSDTSALTDIGAAITTLRSSPAVGQQRIGVMGFCAGGRIALLTGLSTQPVSACVMFYGPPVTEPAELQKLSCPLLGLFGADDEGITPETVRIFEENLKKAGKTVEIKVYENAGHAFMNDVRPSYRPEAAADAWQKVEDFLARNLKAA